MDARTLALVSTALVTGCMTPHEEIPLATARVVGVVPCMGCRDPESVIVTLAGDDALPDAVVVVHDPRVTHEFGQHPAAAVRADAEGRWRVTLRGLRVPGRAELPVLAGDALEVFQKDGEGDASLPYRIMVPRPDVPVRPSAPIIEPDPMQAADPWPDPAGE